MVAYKIEISGKVQGVFFRAFVEKHAKQLNITGWVKNTPDGKVEILAQGEKDNINSLIQLCRKGPLLAKVDNLKTKTAKTKKYKEFKIKR